ALSSAHANLLPLPKRIRDSGYLSYVEVDSRESSELSRSRETDVGVDDMERGIDVRVVAETVVQDEIAMDVRDMVEGGVDRVTHLVVSDDVQETAQEERAVEGTKMPNTRSGASMTLEAIDDLIARCVAEAMEAREAAMNLEPLNEIGDKQEGDNDDGSKGGSRGNVNGRNGNGGHRGNENGGNEGNGNGGRNGNGNRNGNHGMTNG
ncbi:hypothetical protein Tco_1307918, partial [Tanacetum coccineum]